MNEFTAVCTGHNVAFVFIVTGAVFLCVGPCFVCLMHEDAHVRAGDSVDIRASGFTDPTQLQVAVTWQDMPVTCQPKHKGTANRAKPIKQKDGRGSTKQVTESRPDTTDVTGLGVISEVNTRSHHPNDQLANYGGKCFVCDT